MSFCHTIHAARFEKKKRSCPFSLGFKVRVRVRCYNPVVGKMPPKIYFSCFLGTKISES